MHWALFKMSGVEAAGLVLGALPLIAKALEQYDFFHPLFSQCAFARELTKFKRTLSARRCLFRTECRILVETVLHEEDLIDEMFLKGSAHMLWQDLDLNERFSRYLGESYEACRDTIQTTTCCIEKIARKTENLEMGMPEKTKVCCSLVMDGELRLSSSTFVSGITKSTNTSQWCSPGRKSTMI